MADYWSIFRPRHGVFL